MNQLEMRKKTNLPIQKEITKGNDILLHPKGIIKIWTRTGDKCPNSEKIINQFYIKFDDLWNYIFVKEVFFDDKNGNVGSIEIDYICPWRKTDADLIEIGRKTLGELWLDGYGFILNWNVKSLDEIFEEIK